MLISLTCISRPVALRPGYTAVFYTPRFSYEVSKTAVPSMPSTGWYGAAVRVYGLGRVYGVGIRVGIPGEYPSSTRTSHC